MSLYIQSSNLSTSICENIMYEYSVLNFSVSTFNQILGTSATSHEEIRDEIIELLTNGNEQWDVIPAIPMLKTRYNEIQTQIQLIANKFDMEYLDVSGYINVNEDLQSDYVHLNESGYTKLTPYIVNKVKEMFK